VPLRARCCPRRQLSNLLYLGLFLFFLAIIVVIRLTRDRRAVIALFAYVIAVHAVLVFAKRDAWPFVTHGVFLESGNEYRPLNVPRFEGVDGRAWSPLNERTLGIWWLAFGRKMPVQEQDAALAFLLRRAHSAGAIRVLLVTRVPHEKLVSGAETSQVMAQYPR
jgi:hypothetical protein